MNYISQLQETVKAQQAALARGQEQIETMMAYLHGPKFSGQESDGSRKDWIATGDVLTWLQSLRSQLHPE